MILNNSIFSASAVHNKSGCSIVTPAVKLPWRPSVNKQNTGKLRIFKVLKIKFPVSWYETGNLFEGRSPKISIIRWSVRVSLTGRNYEQFRWYWPWHLINKFDQIDEADCMFIFQIKHQYSFWIIPHILCIVTGFNLEQIFMTPF